MNYKQELRFMLLSLIILTYCSTNVYSQTEKKDKGKHMFWGIIGTVITIGCAGKTFGHLSQYSDYQDLSQEEGDYWDKQAEKESRNASLWLIATIVGGVFSVSEFNKALKNENSSEKALINVINKKRVNIKFPDVSYNYINKSYNIDIFLLKF